MQRPWLAHYPPGIPADIDPGRYRSLVQLLEESFEQFAERPAFVCMGKTLAYADIDAMSRKLGAWLQSRGLPRGARVALMMPNVLQYPVAIAAVLRAGYTVVNVNPLYTAPELQHQLKDSGAEAIVILENFASTLQKVLPETAIRHIVVASMGDLMGGVKGAIVNAVVRHVKKLVPPFSLPGAVGFRRALAQGAARELARPEVGPEDVAFLQYTGGTTGVAKGAVLLHRNLVANVLQCDAWLLTDERPAGKEARHSPHIFVCALPLYHIFGLTVCGLLGMRAGGLNVMVPNPRDIPDLVRTLSGYRFTLFPGVNTLFNALLHNEKFRSLDFSCLRVSVGGGMAVQKAVADRWVEVTKSPLCEGYGLSETSPVACCTPIDIKEYSGTIGIPLPSTEAAILDDDGAPLPIGERGEIALRGPQVMPGYWNMPEETARVMTADGFFKTGDIGIMDERGYIRIVDRKKDMILVSGFNVYPNEVEAVVSQHPGVLECAAIGVPDEHSGEAVKVVVVKRDPALTEQDLKAFCRDRLTGYKRPRYVEFRSELPKTNVGKILRRELRAPAEPSH
ncbi:long-chain-fatty-acid--CoA ligase [Pigmentiphaga sp.]|uniref:long-chain-fatty-acid--CoA ligase n=1 Tax=Pigmentiphaga sp. TaxID=1977564 RepID=UPI00128AE7B9|nr:long-chain-fatty-acid--CoA ligase [Pigmentiphaga sp.]MPS50225.1 long-chain-fatty-acid--CoA ligase [Alcaligenaceae bacterium SAGV3]MPT55683.1 long-chain-fatty-acid--CoA ligase [Alcaligenaceae bacterium]